MARATWLAKTEPSTYSWDDLVRDGGTRWDGVRNPLARNHLAAMKVRDWVLIYHSGDEKAIVGIASVKRAAYPDPTADDERWVAIDMAPVKPLVSRVPLATVKKDTKLGAIALVRQSRLSVLPLDAAAFARILEHGRTKPPR
jgi:predicted RNA-binding protein with PUA-like domain